METFCAPGPPPHARVQPAAKCCRAQPFAATAVKQDVTRWIVDLWASTE